MSLLRVVACAVLGAAFLGGCATSSDDAKTVRVLIIGNSFSICCMNHLPTVAEEADVPLDVASLFLSKSTLAQHWENARNPDTDYAPYEFWRCTLGNATRGRMNIPKALTLEKWDVVTIQQASADSWKRETYSPGGDELVALIRRLAPSARIYIQETWSYTPWDGRLAAWGLTADEMYARLHAANESFAQANGIGLIRMGEAVQTWRRERPVAYTERSFGGDVVGGGGMRREEDCFKRVVDGSWQPMVDVCHLNAKGKYFQALVWAARILDVKTDELEYHPVFVTEEDAELMGKIAGRVAR